MILKTRLISGPTLQSGHVINGLHCNLAPFFDPCRSSWLLHSRNLPTPTQNNHQVPPLGKQGAPHERPLEHSGPPLPEASAGGTHLFRGSEVGQQADLDQLVVVAGRAELAAGLPLERGAVRLAAGRGAEVEPLIVLSGNRLVVVTILLESIVLLTAWAVPTVEVPVRHHRANTTEPAIHLD